MNLPFTNNKYYFKPGFFLTIVFISMTGLFFYLGIWQTQRAEEKKILAEQVETRMTQVPLTIARDTLAHLNETGMEYRAIQIKGAFDTTDQFFVDNKKHQGQAGYHVITAFAIADSEQRILVNRGWVSSGNNRNVLPEVKTSAETITLSGRLDYPVEAKYRPGISQPADKLGGIWLYIDVEFFNKLSGNPVAPYILLLDKHNPYGFVRNWPEFKANTQMHLGYALQWFAFAFFSLLVYIAIGIKKHDK